MVTIKLVICNIILFSLNRTLFALVALYTSVALYLPIRMRTSRTNDMTTTPRLSEHAHATRESRAGSRVFAMAGSGEHDVSFEVLLIGDSWVGKSCVAETYDEDSPHPTSLGRTMGK